jgi:hypothetical protein
VNVDCNVTEIRTLIGQSDIALEINPVSNVAIEGDLPVYDSYPCSKQIERELRLESFTDFSLNLHVLDPNVQTLLPNFLAFSDLSGKFSILTSDPTLTGEYQLRVVASEPLSGTTNSEVVFKLTLACTITELFSSVKEIENINYVIPAGLNSARKTVPIPSYAT